MDPSTSADQTCMQNSECEDRMGNMDDEQGMLSGRDSPIKPAEGMEITGEDILAKLRQQVSAASIMAHHNTATSPSKSPNAYYNSVHNNNILPHNHLFDRLNSLLQAKMKTSEMDLGDGGRDLALRAEALQRQRETLLTSPQSLMQAMRVGPPSLVAPNPHLPFLPPVSQMPPTPGSGGSSSSGNGNRTPSHTPEPSHNQQPWTFEEQFKQVRHEDYELSDRADSPRVREPAKHSSFEDDKRKLYEISPDTKRKDFLDELFSYMQKRGTPINRLPIMAKQVLDLYELYNLVVERGGLVDVINKKLWQEIIKGLKLPSSITSAAFTLRTQYMKYLYPFECEKRGLSSPAELQCAIDGNRREGRRSSYGTYGDMMQPPMLPLQNLQNFQNFHNHLGLRPQMNGNAGSHPILPQDLLLGRGGSPPGSQEALLEATRLTMWKLYNGGFNGLGGDEEGGPKPPPHMPIGLGPQPPQKEALNLDNDPWPSRGMSHSKDNGDLRHKEEASNRPPSAKRQATIEDDPPHSPPRPNGSSSSMSLPGANIKISSRGDSHTNDQSLEVNMEINGISYRGVLFAQAQQRATRLGHG